MANGLPINLPWQNITDSELLLVKTNIAGYFFDGFLDVSHSVNTVVTSHQVQKGASIADHAYIEPVEVTMTVKMSDAMSGMKEAQFQGISYTRSTAAYRILREIQKQRLAFQVHTRLETYQNMMITGLSVQDDLQNLNGLKCTVTMQELLVASEKTVKISKREQTTTTNNSGTIQAKDLTDESLLYMIMGKSRG